MTDDRSIFFSLTVRENLRVARGKGDVLTLFPELERLLDRPAGLLSGGEQQMLGLANVLSREPKLLLIDELSFGLAPLIVQRLMKAVRDAADAGMAVVIVEQFARLALDVADVPTCSSTAGSTSRARPGSCGRTSARSRASTSASTERRGRGESRGRCRRPCPAGGEPAVRERRGSFRAVGGSLSGHIGWIPTASSVSGSTGPRCCPSSSSRSSPI